MDEVTPKTRAKTRPAKTGTAHVSTVPTTTGIDPVFRVTDPAGSAPDIAGTGLHIQPTTGLKTGPKTGAVQLTCRLWRCGRARRRGHCRRISAAPHLG